LIVLGIESSCDETGIAIYDFYDKKLLANALYSQIKLHAKYGGVVPELASRDHIKKLNSLTQEALKEANLSLDNIDAVAYTAMPGLVGALMVGASFAKSIAYTLDIPAIAVNHLEGHLLSVFLNKDNFVEYPYVALLVSGGHTQLFYVEKFGEYQLLGESIDDAAGEAFDKTAKMLGLPYPGGVEIARLAEKSKDNNFFKFTTPMNTKQNLNFSFSGLKTAVLQTWQKQKDRSELKKADLCHAFQETVIESLFKKSQRAIEVTGAKKLIIAGGVSANKSLRERFYKLKNAKTYYPTLEYCTDNGAMIAIAGAYRLANDFQDTSLEIIVKPRATP